MRYVNEWLQRFKDSGGWAQIPDRRYEAKAKDGKAELWIYEQIGRDFWDGSGVTAKQVVEDLKALGDVKSIDLHISSPGGDVFEADAIYTNLVAHKAKVNVFIDGIAASAASYIAMAGDTVAIAEHAKFMIHNAFGFGLGNASELRKLAEVLDVVDGSIRTIYQRRTKQDESKLSAWMAAETWFTGQQALDEGFADSLIKAKGSPKDSADIVALMNMRLELARTA